MDADFYYVHNFLRVPTWAFFHSCGAEYLDRKRREEEKKKKEKEKEKKKRRGNERKIKVEKLVLSINSKQEY